MAGRHPFFEGMQPAHIAAIRQLGEAVEFDPGEVIFKAGADATHCYLIDEGDVTLEVVAPGRANTLVQTLHGGDVLGWSWLVEPYQWMFDAVAVSPTRATRFPAAQLRELTEQDHELGYAVLNRFTRVLLSRMQAARLQLLDVYGTQD